MAERRVRFRKSDGDRIADSVDQLSVTLGNLDSVIRQMHVAQVKLAEEQLEVKKSLQLIAICAQEVSKTVMGGANPGLSKKDAIRSLLLALAGLFDGDNDNPLSTIGAVASQLAHISQVRAQVVNINEERMTEMFSSESEADIDDLYGNDDDDIPF